MRCQHSCIWIFTVRLLASRVNIHLWANCIISHCYCWCWLIPTHTAIGSVICLDWFAVFPFREMDRIFKCRMPCRSVGHPLNVVRGVRSCKVPWDSRILTWFKWGNSPITSSSKVWFFTCSGHAQVLFFGNNLINARFLLWGTPRSAQLIIWLSIWYSPENSKFNISSTVLNFPLCGRWSFRYWGTFSIKMFLGLVSLMNLRIGKSR